MKRQSAIKTLSAILSVLCMSTVFARAEDNNSCISKNGTLNVDASIDAKTEMLHTVSHHWKFEFWRGAVCWGRPDDQHNDSDSFSEKSKLCTGELVYNTNKPGYHNYTPVKISWGANLTENDVFKVKFTEKTIAAAYDNSASDCTSHQYGTNLDKYVGKFAANAQVEIPADVWILVVRTIKNKEHITDLPTYLGTVSADKTVVNQMQLTDEWKYVYVEPGQKIDLLVEEVSGNLNADRSFNVDFEFRFVGHNRCEELLGPYEKFNFSEKAVDNIIIKDPQTEEERNFYALRLGCLRNKAYLQAGMANSRSDYLLPVLNKLTKKTQSILKSMKAKDAENNLVVTPEKKRNVEFMDDILSMSLLDMGRFALSDLYAYCETYREFTREGVGMGAIDSLKGIEYSTNSLSRIRSILAQFQPVSILQFAEMLKASEAEGITYRNKMRDSKDVHNAIRVFASSIMRSGYEGFRKISDLIKALPKTTINSVERAEILARLDQAHKEAALLETEVIATLHKFQSRKPDIISSNLVAKYSKVLETNVSGIRNIIESHMAWLVASNGKSKFVDDVGTTYREYVGSIAVALSAANPDRDLRNFVKEHELKTLMQKMDICIQTPTGDL